MNGEPDADEFDAIVSEWRREGRVPQWPTDAPEPTDAPGPTDPAEPPDTAEPTDTANPPTAEPGPLAVGHTVADHDPVGDGPAPSPDGDPAADDQRWTDAIMAAPVAPPTRPYPTPPPDDDHFVPPEPPPLPRLGPPALVGLTLIVLGLVLVSAPGWVGVPTPYGLPLGLVSMAAGLGWLVLRLWPDPLDDEPGNDGDDGAIV